MQSRTKPKAFLGKRQPDAKRAEFELIAPQKISPETRKATLTFQRGLLLCCGDHESGDHECDDHGRFLRRSAVTSLRPGS
jgi:hypothetical protein